MKATRVHRSTNDDTIALPPGAWPVGVTEAQDGSGGADFWVMDPGGAPADEPATNRAIFFFESGEDWPDVGSIQPLGFVRQPDGTYLFCAYQTP